jgi:hypothetical protein
MMGELGALLLPMLGDGGGFLLVGSELLGGLMLKVYLVWCVVNGGRSMPLTKYFFSDL